MNRFDSDNVDINIVSEYKRVKYRRLKPDKRALVFAIGGVLGIVSFYLLGGGNIILSGSFWSSSFSVTEHTGLFQYVFSIRFKQLMFLLICSFSYFGNLMAYGTLGVMGFEFVLIFLSFVYNYKLKGILISIAMLLPQGIFYILLLTIIFERCYDDGKPSIYKEKAIALWKIIMGVILFLLGFLCETCMNYEVLKNIL
jgi:hypothetical protein